MQTTKEMLLDEDTTITLVMLPAMRATKLLARLGRIFGPALQAAFSGPLGEQDMAALATALDSLLQRLTPDELEALTRELLVSCKAGTGDLLPQFDRIFRGRILSVFEVLKEALVLNYGDFFGALAGLAEKAKAAGKARAAGSPSNSPAT